MDWYGNPIDKSFENAMNKIKNSGFEQIISLHPVTHEIISLMNSADAIGLFSFYEGFPNAVCEGMACKKVVISTSVSDVPKLLSHDENLLCIPESPQSIRNAIRYFINLSEKQRTQIGLQNRKVAEKNFMKKNIVSQYLNLFEHEK
ncbi:MAG: glycosyltransferase family 4 protein [Chloroflexia bacterium]|nr:glycosyltransferase family 4 protein [Chloroflexia bacterium]